MSIKEIIATPNAPQAIGTYSQAVKVGSIVYLSGQIPLIPETMEMIEGGIVEQATQVFKNLSAVAHAADGTLDDAAKVNISLTDLGVFAQVNEVMSQFFSEPYPARACVQVAALPRDALIEVEVILAL